MTPKNQSNQNQSSSPAHTLHIDQQQAQRQLDYLGYKAGDNVYLRFFYHSDDPRKNDDKGRKLDRLRWRDAETYQQNGRGVYVVVNGSGGGHEDKDIKQCAAIFCEWDDRPLEEQLLHWETVGFLEPTFTIYSGDKSAQPYWVFDQPITVEQWRSLQCLLIEVMGADASNKNPSRVFRLAGGWHVKPGRSEVRSEIVQDSGIEYSYEQLRSSLLEIQRQQQPPSDRIQADTPIDRPRQQATTGLQPYIRYDEIALPVPKPVPLYQCLSKESRALLDSGVSEGGRNTGGAKLARDLIGTAGYLQSIGQPFDGDPRLLLDEYASHCTPPLPAKEVDTIWKSAEKDRPSPSCKSEGVEACIKGWYWNHHVKPNQPSNVTCSGRGFGSESSSNGGNQPPIATITLCERIREILNHYDQESLQVSALMDLAAASARSYRDISQLARIIRAEGDDANEIIEAVKSFRSLLNSCRKRLDIKRFLEPELAELLLAKAAAMPTAPEYLFNTVLAASASRIGTAAQILVNPAGGYKQPCIIWAANVSHSGQAKTPPQQEIIQPLEQMEAAAKDLYDTQVEDYQQDDDKNAKSPVRQRRLLNNVTTSTKIRIHEENPRGLLEYIDELVADYQRLNQYKSGKGDDLQLELSFWNGSGCNYDRSDVRLFLQRTAFSKIGTYQWDTLARLMADEVNFIASGYSARFLYCSILDAPPRYLDLLSNQYDNPLQAKLTWLYSELEKLPLADYLLDHEAKVLFQGWNHTLVNAETEESHFGMSLVYPKIEANTVRIALWLHIVNAVLRGEKPAPVINGTTMQHAIEIASFYLWQHKLIHAHNSPTRKLEGIFLKVQTLAEKVFTKSGAGIGASFAKSRLNTLKTWVVEKIRSGVFKVLATAGFGRVEGEGGEMTYIPNTVPGNIPPTDPVGDFSRVGASLVVPPTTESKISSQVTASVGDFGESIQSTQMNRHAELMPEPEEVVESKHQFTNSTNSSAEDTAPPGLQTVGDHQLCHQKKSETSTELGENLKQPLVEQSGSTIEIGVNSPTASDLVALILQCKTWVEIIEAVQQDSQKFIHATKDITKEQRRNLVSILATHLCQNPTALNHLAWVPSQLRDRALELLSFTIQRIGGTNILDACVEKISGCKFVSVQQIGTRYEHWVFHNPLSGQNIPVFGLEVVEAIALGSEN